MNVHFPGIQWPRHLSPQIIRPLHISTPWGAYTLDLPNRAQKWSVYICHPALSGTIFKTSLVWSVDITMKSHFTVITSNQETTGPRRGLEPLTTRLCSTTRPNRAVVIMASSSPVYGQYLRPVHWLSARSHRRNIYIESWGMIYECLKTNTFSWFLECH